MKTTPDNFVTVARQDLIKIVAQLKNLRPGRPSVACLKSGRVIVVDGKTFLAAFNSEQYIELPIANYPLFTAPQKTYSEFDIDRLMKYLRAIKDKHILVVVNEGEFIVEAEKSSLKFEAKFLTDMWERPKLKTKLGKLNKFKFVCPLDDLQTALNETSVSMSSEEKRYYLNGVVFEFGDEIIMAATNGHHLTKRHLKIKCGATLRPILPRAAVNHLLKLCDQVLIGSVSVEFNKECAVFEFDDGSVLYSQFVNGNFPDFHRIIPTETKLSVAFDKHELSEALSLFSKDIDRKYIEMKLVERALIIRNKKDSTNLESSIPFEYATGDKIEHTGRLNSAYLHPLIDNCYGDFVELNFCQSGFNESPILIKGSMQRNPGDVSMIMPIR